MAPYVDNSARGPNPAVAPFRPRPAPAIGPDELEAAMRAAEVLYTRYDDVVARVGVRAYELTTEELRRDLSEKFQPALVDSVDMALQLLAHRVELEDVSPVGAAAEYSMGMARRGVPVYVLLNMWRASQEQLLDECFDAVEELDLDSGMKLVILRHMAYVLNRYVEWTETNLVTAYEREREDWSRTSGNLRYALVQRAIEGAEVETGLFENETGYLLDQIHVGVVTWIESSDIVPRVLGKVERAAHFLAERVGATRTPLFAAVDRGTAWIWIPRGQRAGALPPEQVAAAFEGIAGCRVAVGLAGVGVDGFRMTHRQARAARSVAVTAPSASPRVVGYGDRGVALVSMLTGEFAGNEQAVRDWVRELLGPLADSTDNAARLRETLLAYLETGCSLVATAKRTLLHRNSVAYRIQRAGELRGRSIDEDRADLEIALRLAFHLAL
ncbi:helix-turn-helix domain-containing protein (plasmid) [Rhodococcus opacus]|uniref:PucR family transcriptional regulator n=1 Tax=Rhodococcus opacus TaxID=37919 RepID=UPI0034D2AFDD